MTSRSIEWDLKLDSAGTVRDKLTVPTRSRQSLHCKPGPQHQYGIRICMSYSSASLKLQENEFYSQKKKTFGTREIEEAVARKNLSAKSSFDQKHVLGSAGKSLTRSYDVL
jgi:hypothetical protein